MPNVLQLRQDQLAFNDERSERKSVRKMGMELIDGGIDARMNNKARLHVTNSAYR